MNKEQKKYIKELEANGYYVIDMGKGRWFSVEKEERPIANRIVRLLMKHFKGDQDKVELWLNTRNPLLGDQIPYHMMIMGSIKKLLDFIEVSLWENKPPNCQSRQKGLNV